MIDALSTGKSEKKYHLALSLGGLGGVETGRPSGVGSTGSALNINAEVERSMSLTLDKPGVCPAQALEDPLVANARFLNEAADLERRLAIRRALRPVRSAAASRGWETRRDR